MSAPASHAAHEEEALGKVYDTRLMGRLWPYVAPYWPQVVLTLLLVAPMFALELAPAWIVKVGLDSVFGGTAAAETSGVARTFDAWIAAPEGVPGLVWLAGLYLAVIVLSSVLFYVHAVLMARTGQLAMRDLRRDVFDHLQSLHLGYFDKHPVGRLVTRASNDVESVQEMFAAGIVALITDLLKMVGFAVMLFVIDARLALMSFLIVPVLAVATVVFRLRVREAFRLVRVRIARINTYLQETVTGMKVVQLFTREARNEAEFESLNAAHRDAWFMSIRYDAALFAVVEVATGITVAVIIGYGAGLAAAGHALRLHPVDAPLLHAAARPVGEVLGDAVGHGQRRAHLPAARDRAGGHRIRPEPVDARPGPGRGGVPQRALRLSGRGLGARGPLVPRPPGRAGGVRRCATGAGKTSVIKLLTRFYDVQRGRRGPAGRRGHPLPGAARPAAPGRHGAAGRGALQRHHRRQHRPRPQTTSRAARSSAPRSAVEAHRFIERLPQGYDTQVSEKGSNLSTGSAAAACPSPARWCTARRCWCSTRPRAPSIRRPRRCCSGACTC